MSAIEMPKRDTPRWTIDQLKYPNMWAAFERATRLKIRREILVRKNPHCRYCGVKLTMATATLDHVQPTSQGGTDDEGNTVLACRRCSACKADRTPLEWVTDILNGPKPAI